MPAPGPSLGNADLVISISSESVNAQIKSLYNTKIEDTNEYIIPRILQITQLKKDGSPGKHGLFAYCECPVVDFSGDKHLKSNTAKYTTARISFKLRKNPKTHEDAKISYYDSQEEEVVTLTVNDFTMGWEIDIGFKNIQSILQDIVNRNNVPSTASTALGKYMDPQLFTVSSLFCSFQAATMARTFALYDANGKALSGDKELGFINLCTSWFKDTADGLPNRRNPFILGYTIAQTLPDLSKVTKATKPPPEYFVPSNFRCSLSPRVPPPVDETAVPTPLPSGNDLCGGTINYLLRTFRPEGVPTRGYLAETDGRFASNSFSVIGRKATPGGLDGFMVISADTWNEWFSPNFEITHLDVYKNLRGYDLKSYTVHDGAKFKEEAPITNQYMQGRTLKREFWRVLSSKGDWESDGNYYFRRQFHRVRSNVSIDFSNTAAANDSDDTKHAVKIVVTSRNEISIEGQTRILKTFSSNNEPEKADDNDPAGWELSKGSYAWLNFQYTFIMRPDPANRGSLQLVLESQAHLNDQGKMRTFERRRQGGASEWGAWADWNANNIHGFASLFGSGYLQTFANSLAQCGESKLKDAVARLADTFKASIILPAAQVFTFKGMDVDESGNLYVGIAYDTPQGEQVSRKVAQGVHED